MSDVMKDMTVFTPAAIRKRPALMWRHAARLRTARLDMEMSQRDVAKASGVGQKSISSFETGERVPRVDVLLAILWALHVTPHNFFSDDQWIHER